MSKEKIAVLVDSGCDISQDCLEKYGLWLLPLHIDYPEKAYLDGVDIDPQMVYDRYPKDYPKTSTPSLQEVLDKLEEIADAGFDKVIAVTKYPRAVPLPKSARRCRTRHMIRKSCSTWIPWSISSEAGGSGP